MATGHRRVVQRGKGIRFYRARRWQQGFVRAFSRRFVAKGTGPCRKTSASRMTVGQGAKGPAAMNIQIHREREAAPCGRIGDRLCSARTATVPRGRASHRGRTSEMGMPAGTPFARDGPWPWRAGVGYAAGRSPARPETGSAPHSCAQRGITQRGRHRRCRWPTG